VASTAFRAAPEPLREPASFPGAFAYERTDIPPGMTAGDYRRRRARRRRGFLSRALRRDGR
jgi:hypothetical protein